jgi:hypothetical protein
VATTAELLQAVADTIADYRDGEIARPDAEHVELWLAQFPNDDRTPVLSEMAQVLKSVGGAGLCRRRKARDWRWSAPCRAPERPAGGGKDFDFRPTDARAINRRVCH